MAESLSLPSSSYEELCKITKGYSHAAEGSNLDELAKLMGMSKATISSNNKFLTEMGLINGGNKKSVTDLGHRLGRALDHNQTSDVRKYWKETVQSNENLSGLITTVRIKGGMKEEELSSHILYVSGQNNTKHTRTGSRTIVDILLVANLLVEDNSLLSVATPTDNIKVDNVSGTKTTNEPVDETTETPKPKSPAANPLIHSQLPSIAINIQLHLPETENADIYEKLFKALREQLISPKEQ